MEDNSLFWDILLNNYQTNLLIFARVVGIFAFNPIFARRNTPTQIKVGASLALTIFIAASVAKGQSVPEYTSLGAFAVAVLFEAFIGFALGFLTQLFLTTLLVAGDIMDTQSGLGMAKIYDPASGLQMPLFGSVTTYMFILYFFVTNAHLSYIKIFALSFKAIPVGTQSIDPNAGMTIVNYFGTVLTLAMKIAIPMIAAQLILEFCLGILMKTVPQIQVMVVNIQVKLLFALLLLFLLAHPMSDAIERYMDTMLQSLEGVIGLISKSG